MDNGSLEKHLFATERHPLLSWSRRFNIIRGVALGLQHLHRNGSIHGSIKASNVFLEEGDLTPRLGDFGCSWLEPSSTRDDHHIRAVYGLPEVLGCPVPNCTSKATFRADVFYFGALIIEVVCGRRFFGHGVPGGFRFLVDWVWSLHGDGRILEAVDAELLLEEDGGDLNRTQAERLLLVGLVCSNEDRDKRLDMDAIVEILQSDNVPPPVVPPKRPIFAPTYHHIHTMTTV
uniref:Protein kinase domain-containing protein n=1 Tax=Oryza nivara TaxID=4536 RepID=A0A0E0JAN6_ORYNI